MYFQINILKIINSKKKNILVVGQFLGYGGVQTIHRDLLKAYKKRGYNVYPIHSLQTFLKAILETILFSNTEIAYFSGLSLFFSPLFFKAHKHIFLVHGFYIFEGNKSIKRYLKKYLYELIISNLLLFYRWVYCIAPSPTSSLVNSIKFHKEVPVVPWPVGEDFLNFELKENIYKYHFTFLGRFNSQKINESGLNSIIRLFILSNIKSKNEKIKVAFLIAKFNSHTSKIKKFLEEEFNCMLDIFIYPETEKVCQILSETLYFFNCYEWEAFGLTTIEALCMGCNVVIPSTSPILPIIDNLEDSPVYKYTPSNLLDYKIFDNQRKLTNKRMSIENINYYRRLFNWENFIDSVNQKLNSR